MADVPSADPAAAAPAKRLAPRPPAASAATTGPASGAAITPAKPSAADDFDTFERNELAIVLSHFDLGVLESLEDFQRGSRRAPKLIIKSAADRFLLKRRARGRDEAGKVAFCHEIQNALAVKQFPLPHLILTVRGETMLVLDGTVYELFEYIGGQGYNQSLEATTDAGRVLALYHKLLEDFRPVHEAPTGSYHAAPAIEKGFERILRHFAGRGDVAPTCRFLLDSYRHARHSVDDAGIAGWPAQIVHGDWHPGNLLFRDSRVVAVIDYDSARLLPRVIDSANGALQFSILGGGDDPATWPDYIDESRFKRFLRGYDEVNLLSQAELRATPWLMIEALVAEAVFPIAATGQFGKLEGGAFLGMVQRKVVWLQRNADRLVELVAG